MKITNWCKQVGAALLASGLLAPAAAVAYDIPLGDPSFEAYVLPATTPAAGYAYAGIVSVHYRPTSAWISRPGAGNFQDGGPTGSNWIYNAAYAESASAERKRPAPRTGAQAMHGRVFVSGQEVAQTFEAGATYTFSMWAQGDSDAALIGGVGWDSRVYLMIYNGALFGNETPGGPVEVTYETSLTYNEDEHNPLSPNFTYFPHDRFAPPEPIPPEGTSMTAGNFVNRNPSWTAAQSRAAWQKISVSHLVLPGSPEVGSPIGVAFQVFADGALDDASLSVLGPGDLNRDLAINAADWNIFRTNLHAALPGGTPAETYFLGDLNGDLKNDHQDYVIFKNSYDDANGPGAFVAMIASIPEPSAAALAAAASAGLLVRRRRT